MESEVIEISRGLFVFLVILFGMSGYGIAYLFYGSSARSLEKEIELIDYINELMKNYKK